MRILVSFTLALFLLPVLATGAVVSTPSMRVQTLQQGNAELEFNKGVELYRAGEFGQALSRFRSFVLRHNDSPQVSAAYEYLGRIFLQQQRYADALLYLERIVKSQRSPEASLLIGYCLVRTGEYAKGLQALLPVSNQVFSQMDTWRLNRALASAYTQLQKPLQGLVFYQRALVYAEQPEELLAEVHQLLQKTLSDADLEEAGFMFHGTAIGQDALLQSARRALARRDEQRSRRLLQLVLTSPVSFPYRQDAATLMDRFSTGSWLQHDSIGVLLPQSGRYAAFGELVQRGMELALKLHNASRSQVKFIYRDTEGDASTSTRMAASLANEERVMAIAGPLTGAAAIAAAVQAQQDQTPLLTLSQRANIPTIGNYIFRNSLTPRLQARALARYAVEQQGYSSFGILYPENRLGREMAELFAEEVLKLGGLVIDEQSYAEEATDFRQQIKLLMGQDPGKREEILFQPRTEEEILADLFKPDLPEYPPVTFEALFIPDYADRIGLIAPQLAFYGINDFPLLGINGWNSPELLRLAGRFVEQAVFVDGFFRYSNYPFVKEFVDLYFETYNEEPSILEAQAFDTANILLDLVDNPAIQSREDIRLALTQLQGYPGVTGATGFDFSGEAEKLLFLLQVQKGRIVQIN